MVVRKKVVRKKNKPTKITKLPTNPKKETLACGWVVSFDKKKKGKINKLEWTHEVLKDWKPGIDY